MDNSGEDFERKPAPSGMQIKKYEHILIRCYKSYFCMLYSVHCQEFLEGRVKDWFSFLLGVHCQELDV